MRILMITASLPYPLASGGAIRTYGILHGLHTAGHDVTLLSFHGRDITPEDTPLSDYCSRIETVPPPVRTKTHRLRDMLLSTQPDIARRLYSETFYRRLQALLSDGNFDLIQFEGIEVACYLPLICAAGTSVKLCYDAFNAEADLQRVIFQIDRRDVKRWHMAVYSFIQAGRIESFERQICQQADCVVAVSPEDAAILRHFRPDRRVFVVPNGIFSDNYGAPDEEIALGEYSIVFTGKMDYRPNVDAMLWFANDILPSVRQQVAGAHLTIVGQKPHARLNVLQNRPDVTITEWVESVQPYLHAAAVYVAPLRMGSGTRLKILEAMASGCAVVATSIAASGLLSDTRQAMIIADSEKDMTAAIIRLLQNPVQGREMGKIAQHMVKRHYDWPVLIPHLLAAFEETEIGNG